MQEEGWGNWFAAAVTVADFETGTVPVDCCEERVQPVVELVAAAVVVAVVVVTVAEMLVVVVHCT